MSAFDFYFSIGIFSSFLLTKLRFFIWVVILHQELGRAGRPQVSFQPLSSSIQETLHMADQAPDSHADYIIDIDDDDTDAIVLFDADRRKERDFKAKFFSESEVREMSRYFRFRISSYFNHSSSIEFRY
jgi:hypothetical protein